MKDREFSNHWVAQNAQCEAGMAWGIQYTKSGAKRIGPALQGFDRADWLIWFMVKADLILIEMALDFMAEAVRTRLNNPQAVALLAKLETDMENPDTGTARAGLVTVFREEASSEANTAMVCGQFKDGHEFTALAFLARMHARVGERDIDEALKDAQCVLNNLVAAKTGSLLMHTVEAKQEHAGLCEWLKSRVVLPPEKR